MTYLNLGCGRRTHPAWTNLDFTPAAPEVRAWDLRKGIPFPDSSVDVVYHSHLLEHLPHQEGAFLIREGYRVLRPGGVLRIVVPDLEGIARAYLDALERAASGEPGSADDHTWMVLEMYDQATRGDHGGAMFRFLWRPDLANADFVLRRLGLEAKRIIDAARSSRSLPGGSSAPREPLRRRLLRFLVSPRRWRERLVRLLVGPADYESLRLGRFRRCGEAHLWMYDRVSLRRLLEGCGLTEVCQRTAADSSIAGWAGFHLDTEPDGSVYKPDSLYMEGRKPGRPEPLAVPQCLRRGEAVGVTAPAAPPHGCNGRGPA